jgi:YVTN family beta-propeller protein
VSERASPVERESVTPMSVAETPSRPAGTRGLAALAQPHFDPFRTATMTRNSLLCITLASLFAAACGGGGGSSPAPIIPQLSTSNSIQLSANGRYAFVLNKVASPTLSTTTGSVTIVRVKSDTGADLNTVVSEIAVGKDPYSLTATADGRRLFVSNAEDNNVSVIDLGAVGDGPYTRLGDVLVGAEPRGTAELNGKIYVANYGEGTLSIIDTTTLSREATIDLVQGTTRITNPYALAALPDGRLWVTDFFARAIPGKPVDQIEGFDDGKEARVAVVQNRVIQSIVTLQPIANAGFNADRRPFDTANGAVNDTFKAPAGVDPAAVPQGAFFNQLFALAYDEAGSRLYLPTVGAQPSPPVRFNVNVQALVGVIDAAGATAQTALHTNLNQQIAANFPNEPAPTPPFTNATSRLDRLFAADTVAASIKNRVGAFVSRAGSYLLKATVGTDGALTLARDSRGAIVRIPVANIPGGVIVSNDGNRAYVASELIGQMTAVDLAAGSVIATVNTATTPTDDLRRKELLGALKFFTGLGAPAQVAANIDPREIDTHRHRNMQSDNNWSSCASCHPFGHSDGVTWIFPTGPRQTLSLDAFFAKGSTVETGLATTDQKISNWNAERNSVTDFNNNSRAVQGGHGFTPQALATIDAGQALGAVPDAGLVFNGGARLGISNILDFETIWVASLRAPNRSTRLDTTLVDQGRTLFGANCASCHGGTKWSRSDRIVDSAFWPDPAFSSAGVKLSNNLEVPAATTIAGFDADNNGSFETRIVDSTVPNFTLDLTNPIEIRGLGGLIGKASAGLSSSFQIPSLFNSRNAAPWGHHGRAQTLGQVFTTKAQGGLEHPRFGLSDPQLAAVLEFVQAIDENQPIFP